MLISGKKFVFVIEGQQFHCSMDVVMHYVGGKWKSVVLWYLRNKTLRFGELKQQIPDITEKMLSLQLKKLEADGIVRRVMYDVVPPKVEYSLTEFGRTLIPLLEAMSAWGRKHAEEKGRLVEVTEQP